LNERKGKALPPDRQFDPASLTPQERSKPSGGTFALISPEKRKYKLINSVTKYKFKKVTVQI